MQFINIGDALSQSRIVHPGFLMRLMIEIPPLPRALGFLKPGSLSPIFHVDIAKNGIGAIVVAGRKDLRQDIQRHVISISISGDALGSNIHYRDHITWYLHAIFWQIG